jgi:hypothetical protein
MGIYVSYNGNPNLKPFGTPVSFTQEQVIEFLKCKADPIYFIKTYCKIVSLDFGLIPFNLYEYQVRFIKALHTERRIISMQPRQHGKTQTVAAYLLHYTIFNDNKTVAVLANKAAAAREILSRYQLMYENLPTFLQHGVKSWNKGTVELENGSNVFTGATSSSGIRGRSVNFLYIDEAAIIQNTVADEFFTSTYPTISAGQTTKIVLTSTPLGLNHFWKFWNEAVNGVNGFMPIEVSYSEHPDHDEAWANEQRQLLGELKFNQEVGCSFLGSSATLISPAAIQRMSPLIPLYKKDSFISYEAPVKGSYDEYKREWIRKPGSYAICVDTSLGVGQDAHAFTVIRIDQNPYKQVAVYKDNKISPLLFPNVIYKWAKEYNDAWVLIEMNKSEQIAHILHNDLEYENMVYVVKHRTKGQIVTGGFGKQGQVRLGVTTDKKTKRIGCAMLKTLVEEMKLQITDADTISEISTFIEHKDSYAADDGYSDDIVMTLVLFGWLTSHPFFREMTNIDLRLSIYQARLQAIEEEVLPVGSYTDGTEEFNGDQWVEYHPY